MVSSRRRPYQCMVVNSHGNCIWIWILVVRTRKKKIKIKIKHKKIKVTLWYIWNTVGRVRFTELFHGVRDRLEMCTLERLPPPSFCCFSNLHSSSILHLCTVPLRAASVFSFLASVHSTLTASNLVTPGKKGQAKQRSLKDCFSFSLRSTEKSNWKK